MPLGGQQRGQPIGKSVEADGLKEVENHQHQRPPSVGRLPDLGEACGAEFFRNGRRWRRQPAAEAGLNPGLEVRNDALRSIDLAVSCEPARRFRQAFAQPPDSKGAAATDQHNPPPACNAIGVDRNQQI
jgi:hypothetical protein